MRRSHSRHSHPDGMVPPSALKCDYRPAWARGSTVARWAKKTWGEAHTVHDRLTAGARAVVKRLHNRKIRYRAQQIAREALQEEATNA